MLEPHSRPPSSGSDAVPGSFRCEFRTDGRDAAWVCVAGELDIASQAGFTLTLSQAARAAHLVVLDLRHLSFMDCAGLRTIVEASDSIRGAGQRLVVIRGPAQVHRLFALTGIGQDLELLDLAPAERGVQALLQLARHDQVA